MPAINLLPKDLTPKEGVVKVADLIKKIVTIGFTGLIVSLIVLIASYFYINEKIKEAQKRQENIKIEISALEQTEVRLVLVKDRLQKAETILALDTAKEEINKLDLLFDLLPSGAEINETDVSLNGTTLIIHTDNSAILSEFLAKIVSSGIYSGIGLHSLQYNQFTGFILELMLSG